VPHARRPGSLGFLVVIFGPTLPTDQYRIDAAGIEGLEHAETLDHRDGSGVAQLDRAAPTRILLVAAAIWPINTAGAELATPTKLVLGNPVTCETPTVRRAGEVDVLRSAVAASLPR